MGRRRYSLFMAVTSGLTVLAGGLLFWHSSAGFQWAWIASGPGLMFSVGSVVGIAVFFLGLLMIKPRVERMDRLGQTIAVAGGPPAPEWVAELRRLDRELTVIGRLDSALLIVALLTMATARYWWV